MRAISYTLAAVDTPAVVDDGVAALNPDCLGRTVLEASGTAGAFIDIQQNRMLVFIHIITTYP